MMVKSADYEPWPTPNATQQQERTKYYVVGAPLFFL
jgi:hypothetical protein